MGWIRRVYVAPIRFYRKFLSPLKPPMCRFDPTCSQYGLEAIMRHGIFKGTGLGIWRIMRCHPFSKGRHDPVPPRKGETPSAD